jgi:hypothetical protein
LDALREWSFDGLRLKGSDTMSIFGSIRDLIFGGAAHASSPSPSPSVAPATGTTPIAGAGAPKAAAMAAVDVAAILDAKAEDSDEDDLDWRKSIVDLMKILGLDSGLKARRLLADELGYKGDKGDTAKMNVWLHRQVMNKLAENGGKVPDDLKD